MVFNSAQSTLYHAVDAYNSSLSSECTNKFNREEPKTGRNDTDNCRRIHEAPPPKSCVNPRRYQKNPLNGIFSDSDSMLILGLIFLLMSQDADDSLILALAFILLS